MNQHLAHIALVVKDYEEAINFYTRKLDFTLVEDTPLTPEKRWVRVRPSGGGCELLLAKAANERQLATVGNQTGGRVFLFLYTDDFHRDFKNYTEREEFVSFDHLLPRRTELLLSLKISMEISGTSSSIEDPKSKKLNSLPGWLLGALS
jgi:catechol 2,3-dioxygenase-like lactoylglutathione lyase family enzyme